MTSRYVVAKLFFVLAVFCALIGTTLFRREVIGSGLTAEDYLNPLFWVTTPRLIPFTAAFLSVFFGLAYFGLEKRSKQSPNIPLAFVHIISYLLAFWGLETLARFWWRVLGEEHASIPLTLWAGVLTGIGFTVCFLACGANVFLSLWRVSVVTNKPE
jgi:hypothetical protein